MNTFANAIVSQDTQTTNGMKAHVSTKNDNLDLFGKVGAARTMDITPLFSKAYNENREFALRIAQYARDVRGGLGERKVYRDILNYLEIKNPNDCKLLLAKTPELGRWDDLLVLKEKETKDFAYEMIATALGAGDGLCAKWMPRKGVQAAEIRVALGMSPKQYRKTLVHLTSVVETLMCKREWQAIDYSGVPSVAFARYKRAFGKNDQERFSDFLDKVSKGEEKVNAGAVLPMDVLRTLFDGIRSWSGHSPVTSSDVNAIEAQWNALPNLVGDHNVIPVVDTSGSMWTEISKGTTAYMASVSLGMYLADKNQGKFAGCFVSFASSPTLSYVKGSIVDKFNQVKHCLTMGSTNLEATFAQILKVAKDNQLPSSEMPESIIIFSDMQFNQAVEGAGVKALSMISKQYKASGYTRPKIIFWNLVGNYDNVPVRFDEAGTAFVSGYSIALLKSVLSNNLEQFTPMNVMLDAIMNERYNIAG